MVYPVQLHPRMIRMFHRILLVGAVSVGVAFLIVMQVMGGALNTALGPVGYAFVALGLALLGVAALLLRPRVTERMSGQTEEAFWLDERPRTAAILLWVVCEGAGIVGWTGFLLTGMSTAATVGVLAIVALGWFSPARLAGL